MNYPVDWKLAEHPATTQGPVVLMEEFIVLKTQGGVQ